MIIDSDTIIETLAKRQIFLDEPTMVKAVDILTYAKVEKDDFLKWVETLNTSTARNPVAYFMASLRYFTKTPYKEVKKGQLNLIGIYRLIEKYGIERPTTREYILTEEILVDWVYRKNSDPESIVMLINTVCAYMCDKKLTRYEDLIYYLVKSKFARSINFDYQKIDQKKVDEKAKAWDDLIDDINHQKERGAK